MDFNSIQYGFFLPLVFVLYWAAANRNLKLQNLLLLASSYFFYACWDYRFLALLLFSSFLCFYAGLRIYDAEDPGGRKFWLRISILVSIGLLGVFKYFNFFLASFSDFLRLIGFEANPWSIQLVLPVGISFYTFHGLSYVIDVYNGRIKPSRDFIEYALFVSFFPLLVAGPIERATHLLPQLQKERRFDYSKAVDGLRQILWGLFKKVVIADNCAEYANRIFDHSADFSGSTLALGAVFFSFQIYCDFSGYSDIAIGTARLLGIELLRNFAFPYFSRDIAEFWRRWHISLTSWFRDYLYIPLGGSKGGLWTKVRNTFIIFLVSGFWHGANWTFLAWGALNAIYFLPLLLLNKNREHLEIVAKGSFFPSWKELFQVLSTFGLTTFAWIFFRAESIQHAVAYISGLFSASLLSVPELPGHAPATLMLSVLFLAVEWLGREEQYAIAGLAVKWPRPLRWAFYYTVIVAIAALAGNEQQFIYFQF